MTTYLTPLQPGDFDSIGADETWAVLTDGGLHAVVETNDVPHNGKVWVRVRTVIRFVDPQDENPEYIQVTEHELRHRSDVPAWLETDGDITPG